MAGLEALVHGRPARLRNADDAHARLQRLGRHGDAGDEAAARQRHQQGRRLRQFLQHLQAEGALAGDDVGVVEGRSEEHTSELQSLMRTSYAVFCLKKQTTNTNTKNTGSTAS